MAPTICEDDYESNIYRHKRSARYHSVSVINYESSDDEKPSGTVLRNLILDSLKFPGELKIKMEDDDDSVDSSSNKFMSFHSYCKRRKPNNDEINRIRSVSVSSASNGSSVSSSTSEDVPSDVECPLAEPQISSSTDSADPIASTTDIMSLYQRFARTPQTCQQRNLFEIAMKTIVLLRRNRLLQQRLQQLQMETRHFVDSVMSNPENAKLRQSPREINDKESDARVVSARN